MTHEDMIAVEGVTHGIGFTATLRRADSVSPNLRWLDVVCLDCGPRGEAVPVGETRHHVSVRDDANLGFKVGDQAWRAAQVRGLI